MTGTSPSSDALRKPNVEGFSGRLRELRVQLCGRRGQKVFAESVGIPQSSMGKYEKGVSPNVRALTKIIRYSGVCANWLLTGSGGMFSKTPTAHNVATTTIPTLGDIPADIGDLPRKINGLAVVCAPSPHNNLHHLAARQTGDAMAPELLDGDLLIFERLVRHDGDGDGATVVGLSLADVLTGPERHGHTRRLDRRIVLVRIGRELVARRVYLDRDADTAVFANDNRVYSPDVARLERGSRGRGAPRSGDVVLIGRFANIIREF